MFLYFIKALECWLIHFWCLVVSILCVKYFWYNEKNWNLTVTVLKKCTKLAIKISSNCKENEYNKQLYNWLSKLLKYFFSTFETVGRLTSNAWHLFSFLSCWFIPSPDFQGRNYHTLLKGLSILSLHGYSFWS